MVDMSIAQSPGEVILAKRLLGCIVIIIIIATITIEVASNDCRKVQNFESCAGAFSGTGQLHIVRRPPFGKLL